MKRKLTTMLLSSILGLSSAINVYAVSNATENRVLTNNYPMLSNSNSSVTTTLSNKGKEERRTTFTSDTI
ncbi:hypothetical protein [[Clostridium] colinum]|uniref:hypothetical protein n=1 Tax=[Clostridium] colinum TaxID=36835 RepID=UPI0020258CEE|nr:hypothetical protein [[Clostridium] colinum]